MVTGQQVRRLRQKLMQGKTQEAAAAAAGMSVRSAGKWQRGLLPAERKSPRTWRTRPDPFTGIWNDVIEPLLRRDPESALQATTVLEWLEERYPGRFSPAQLRTLQRRLRDWRALHGPEQEVFFPQVHPPGREAQMDFTDAGELRVNIAGLPFPHLFFGRSFDYAAVQELAAPTPPQIPQLPSLSAPDLKVYDALFQGVG